MLAWVFLLLRKLRALSYNHVIPSAAALSDSMTLASSSHMISHQNKHHLRITRTCLALCKFTSLTSPTQFSLSFFEPAARAEQLTAKKRHQFQSASSKCTHSGSTHIRDRLRLQTPVPHPGLAPSTHSIDPSAS
eukprot:138202-Amphidinium_carterae.1